MKDKQNSLDYITLFYDFMLILHNYNLIQNDTGVHLIFTTSRSRTAGNIMQ